MVHFLSNVFITVKNIDLKTGKTLCKLRKFLYALNNLITQPKGNLFLFNSGDWIYHGNCWLRTKCNNTKMSGEKKKVKIRANEK